MESIDDVFSLRDVKTFATSNSLTILLKSSLSSGLEDADVWGLIPRAPSKVLHCVYLLGHYGELLNSGLRKVQWKPGNI